jgi:anti-anti-sigma factor
MTIETESHPQLSVAKLIGHVDTLHAAELESTLLALPDSGVKALLVDCTRLEYINSAGLRVFLLAAKRMESQGGACAFCGLTPNVKLVFETIGFDRILSVYETRETALAAIQPPIAAAA